MPTKKPLFTKTKKLLTTAKEVQPLSSIGLTNATITSQSFVIEVFLDEQLYVRSTHILHVNNDESEKWSGWEPDKLGEFILGRSGAAKNKAALTAKKKRLSQSPAQTVSRSRPKPAARTLTLTVPPLLRETTQAEALSPSPAETTAKAAKVGVEGVVLFDLEILPASTMMPSRAFRANDAIDIGFSFAIDQLLEDSSLPVNYTAILSAKSLDSPLRFSLGTVAGQMQERKKRVVVKVPAASLTMGTYRLEAAVDITMDENGKFDARHYHPGQLSQVIHVL